MTISGAFDIAIQGFVELSTVYSALTFIPYPVSATSALNRAKRRLCDPELKTAASQLAILLVFVTIRPCVGARLKIPCERDKFASTIDFTAQARFLGMAETKTTPGEQIAAKYTPFNIIDVAYKHVDSVPIPTSVLVPKKLTPGKKHPVVVRWHGGGCGTGHRLFADWFGDWTLDLALRHSAIIVSPDYRLMPESKGVDILQDSRDFYTWLFKNASETLPSGIDSDLSKILVTGESAGGWLALQAGFLVPDRVAAIISHYPMVDMRNRHFTEKFEKQLMDTPQLDPQILNDYVAKMESGSIVTSRNPTDSPEFIAIMFQQGSFPKYFGTEKELYPLEMLEHAISFPPTWLIHGTKDSMVPVESSEKFASALRKTLPETPLYVTLQEGEEHGFDLHDAVSGAPASLETGWVKSGLKFVDKYWPSKA